MSTNTMHPTPYPDLNAVLREFVEGAQAVLGDNFLAAYLQGSFAMGDWDTDSDVDFLIATEHDVQEADLPALQAMHGRIYDLDCPWAQHLEGSYFPRATLRRGDRVGEPLLYLDNTSRALIRSEHDNTLVVRWVVREYGISLAGPEAKVLIEPVSAGALRREVRATMQWWAEQLFANPNEMNNRWYQPFAVVSYCRMLHTLHSGRIGSKPAGARWAKGALDSRWIGLIERAERERPNPSLKVRQAANADDLKRTLDFIKYALEVSRAWSSL
jgi:hypothetical protein